MKRGGLFPEGQDGRATLLERWLELTRTVLPALAIEHGWPIRLDHCFMRVCLDTAFGAPWTATVRAPAVRHMTDAQLAAAVAVAEGVEAQPDTLPLLNRASIDGRRTVRAR